MDQAKTLHSLQYYLGMVGHQHNFLLQVGSVYVV